MNGLEPVSGSSPKVSVFSPSHNSRYLNEAYGSLLEQTHEDWEWIVFLNGGAEWEPPDDPRVRCYGSPESRGVGWAKREAVARTTGKIIVELDHDDLLMPEALNEIYQAFTDNPEAVFVYSDFEQILQNGTPDPSRFNEAHGWQYEGTICKSFPPFPSAVSYIWYGPNHVRAFLRSAYEAVGGYDENLDILDDQDLFCRLYQYGQFDYLPKMLYRQRVHDGNTQARPDLNPLIQTGTVDLYRRHISGNALAWARRRGLKALDFGGAHNAAEGFTTVDIHDADITGDVMGVLGEMPDNSVGVIRASDFLEHISDKVGLMNECHRVLAHGGMFLSTTPSSDGRGAYQDPTHISFWNENSFWYYTDSNYAKYVPEITARYQVSLLETVYPTPWHEENKISYVIANLVAVKDGPRLPGLLRW